MHSLRPASIALLVALTGCSVDVDDFTGKRCDDTRGCLDGRVCLNSVCVARTADGGIPAVSDGGSDGGSLSDAGTADAGVTWRQINNGFDRTRETAGTANIAAAAENRLDVQVGSGASQAVGVEENQFPASPSGAFAGRVSMAALPSGKVTIAFLEADTGGAIVRLSLQSDGALTCESSGGTLQPTALVVTSAVGVFSAGATHTLEASFVQGSRLRVWLDGSIACDASLGAFTDLAARPRELRIGFDSYAGTTAVSGTFTGWLYAESPSVRLNP